MIQRRFVPILLFLLCSVVASVAQSISGQPRITQAVDGEKLVRLSGHMHPLAQAQYDRGAAPDDLPLERMMLLLQRGADQEAALRQLLEDQQTRSSPRYHQWLSPEEFGQRFGPADADIAAITNWLRSQGFRVNRVAAGRTVIEFSGTAAQVRQALRTDMRKFVVNGEEHWANASDPQIPAALAPVVRGIVSLHNFRKRPLHRNLGLRQRGAPTSGSTPLTTFGGNAFGLAPYDFATIYNVLPQWTAGIDGTGQTIAVVSRSNISKQDVRDFRALFGLPAKDPVVTPDGPDPGLVPNDESEAILDVEWSGAVAKGATINLVVSASTEIADGIDLSAFFIVDNNLAGILSESFGQCEAFLTDNGNAFYQGMWQQAAAQGITAVVASGDNGSAGCDTAFVTGGTGVATGGLAVNGLASTGFNVAVGGTDFDDAPNYSTYWNSTNDPLTKASALSYIPEMTWNDSCAAAGNLNGCTSVPASSELSGGSGGPSSCATHSLGACVGRPKPSWQTGTGVSGTTRNLPDVSFFGGGNDNSSFYLACEADLDPNNGPCSVTSPVGGLGAFVGTSASVQAFAGVMALVNQKMGGRQGNANYVLYPLAATNPATCNSSSNPTANCIFYDTTKGNISMPCTGGALANCNSVGSGTGVLVDPANTANPAWLATPGYDRATGLGTVNVSNLVNNWNTVGFVGTTTTLNLGQTTNITHGQSVAVNITVTANSGGGTPTGAVSLLASPGTNQAGIDGFILNSSGMTTGATTKFLPGGAYTVFAHYGGDGTFGASDSTPPVPVTVGKENSLTFLNLVINPLGNFTITSNPPPIAYGSPYVLRADVTNTADGFHVSPPCSTGCPTGIVTIKDNGLALDGGSFVLTTGLGSTEDLNIQLAPGAHPLTATYGGDNSFSGSGPANLTVTINKAATSLSAVGGPAQVNLNALFNLTVTVQTNSNGAAPTGTVTFLDGSTALTGQVSTTPIAGSANGPASLQVTLNNTSLSTTGSHTITATYAGDTNYSGVSTAPGGGININVVQIGTFTVAGANTNAAAGASGNSTITVTPSGGFTGPVTVTCPAATLPPGVTCSPSPLIITVTANLAVNGQLTLNVAAPSAPGATAELQPATGIEYAGFQGPPPSRKGWWKVSAGAGLAAIFLLCLPGRRRYRATLGLWLICVLSFAIGCGGGSAGGVVGPVATTTKITAPQTKAAQNAALSFSVAVTATSSGAAAGNGMVQLFDGTTQLGTAVQAANGVAAFNNITSLSVGTHAISAHYLGDANTLASQSGAVNVTVTGSTTVGISTSPASSNSNVTVNLTIN